MTEEKRIQYIVTNQQNQPIELHLSTGVTVLEPRGEAIIEEADLAKPQLQVFQLNLLLSTRPVDDPRSSTVATPKGAEAEPNTLATPEAIDVQAPLKAGKPKTRT